MYVYLVAPFAAIFFFICSASLFEVFSVRFVARGAFECIIVARNRDCPKSRDRAKWTDIDEGMRIIYTGKLWYTS